VRRLGDEANRLLAAAGVPRLDELSAVTEAWPRCVGDTIARSAWPRRLARDGTLHVATVSSTWAFELERLGGDIADRLREALGEASPRALRFAPGPVPEPSADAGAVDPGPLEVSAESRLEGERIASAIADDDLRRLVARAAAASLARARSDRSFC
jgi:hypothetical protein